MRLKNLFGDKYYTPYKEEIIRLYNLYLEYFNDTTLAEYLDVFDDDDIYDDDYNPTANAAKLLEDPKDPKPKQKGKLRIKPTKLSPAETVQYIRNIKDHFNRPVYETRANMYIWEKIGHKLSLKDIVTYICRNFMKITDQQHVNAILESCAKVHFGTRTLKEIYEIINGVQTEKYDAEAPLKTFPFKSKVRFLDSEVVDEKILESVPDYKLTEVKKLYRPTFSPYHNSWEVDLMVVVKDHCYYFVAINENTKYLFMYYLQSVTKDFGESQKDWASIQQAFDALKATVRVDRIRGDGEKAWNSLISAKYFEKNNIHTYFTDSKFTNHNRTVDRVIRTIRDAFTGKEEEMLNNTKVQEVVDIYNRLPHSAFRNLMSPVEVQRDPDLEDIYIKYLQNKLDRVQLILSAHGYLNYKPGNMLLVHVELSKTSKKFDKLRRNFRYLAEFISYDGGNANVKIISPEIRISTKTRGSKNKDNLLLYISVPIYYTKFVCNTINDLTMAYKNFFNLNKSSV